MIPNVFLSFGSGILTISIMLSVPFALLVLVVFIEPRRQAGGKEPLGYFGCLLYALVLSILLGPVGLLLWFLAKDVGALI